jgi:hypothetical protein
MGPTPGSETHTAVGTNNGMKAPHEKRDLCVALIRGLKKALGEKLHGVYLYGAAAFPKTAPTRDVDLHVILREA